MKTVRCDEALEILAALGFPKAQLNQRSALCLLAILDLTPQKAWCDAADPLMGITPIMDWVRQHYGKEYAPNTRETIRRQSMHQFVTAGLAAHNPDDPARPVNSPKAVYQISPYALELLRTYGTPAWTKNLKKYVSSHGPVDGKCHHELASLFASATTGLVYVTAFPSRQVMARYLADIAWETEVWIADAPDHLIHFNGERFLGPHSM